MINPINMTNAIIQAKTKNSSGFTLIEIMIVITVIGILASIALSAYNNYMVKARRADGHNTLLDLANRQQQYFLDNRSYASTNTMLGMAGGGCPTNNIESTEGHYCIAISTSGTGVPTNGYLLTAAPQGIQNTDDIDCGNLTYNSLGVKGYAGSGDRCWPD